MRTYDASESVVITQRVLESERFYWSILSPLQGGQKWDVAASLAVFKTAEHNSEPPNRHALFASSYFSMLAMSTIKKLINKPDFARRFFRQHQSDTPFIPTPETLYPLINHEMFVPSMLQKLTAQVLCPLTTIQASRMYTTRVYPFHQIQLINEINTNFDPSRIQDMLHTPGAFHEWALEVNPQVIFRASNPVNIEYIQERIDAMCETQLEEESIREGIESEIDLPDLENSPPPDEEFNAAEESITGVTQGTSTEWRTTASSSRFWEQVENSRINPRAWHTKQAYHRHVPSQTPSIKIELLLKPNQKHLQECPKQQLLKINEKQFKRK
jgi:hypothetical protein